MEIADQIARVRTEGETLARAAKSGPLDWTVPGCPGWDVEQLLRHVGDVHRWAATIVRDRVQERLRRDFEGPSDGDALIAWYREGHRALVEALSSASPDDTFWFWGPAPNALAFWARRQANETAVHRCDAESARGPITALSTDDALDALDEWLALATRRANAPAGRGRVVRFVPTDGVGAVSVILDEQVRLGGDAAPADCQLRGTASDLYLWSMNRRGVGGLTVSGDHDLLQVWADGMRF